MRLALRLILLAAAFALATLALGWWTVPLLGAAWAVLDSGRRWTAVTASLGATLGWAALLLWNASYSAYGTLQSRVGAIFGAPGALLVVVTLLLAAALAWGAAAAISGVVRLAQRRN